MSTFFRQQLENYLKRQDINADIVYDVGGSQNPVKGRTRSWAVKDYKIVDIEDCPDVKQKPDIIYDIQKKLPYTQTGFYVRADEYEQGDVVFCLEVMEYIFDPKRTIMNLRNMLKRGGLLVISFPFNYPLHPPTGTDYLRYTKYGAIKLLEHSGFDITAYNARKLLPQSKNHYKRLIESEGFRYDKSLNEELFETGSIIKARKQ